jgi:hypothetical protein
LYKALQSRNLSSLGSLLLLVPFLR